MTAMTIEIEIQMTRNTSPGKVVFMSVLFSKQIFAKLVPDYTNGFVSRIY